MLKQKDVCVHARARERGRLRGTPGKEGAASSPGPLKRQLGRGTRATLSSPPSRLHQPGEILCCLTSLPCYLAA